MLLLYPLRCHKFPLPKIIMKFFDLEISLNAIDNINDGINVLIENVS